MCGKAFNFTHHIWNGYIVIQEIQMQKLLLLHGQQKFSLPKKIIKALYYCKLFLESGWLRTRNAEKFFYPTSTQGSQGPPKLEKL